MKHTPPHNPPRNTSDTPPYNAPRDSRALVPAAPPPPEPLAAGLSLSVLAAAQAALPQVRRKRAATASRELRWTRARQVDFLAALAETHSASQAARSVGMSRQSAYRLRARLRNQPFALAWDAAYQGAPHSLYHAALERAIEGVEVPHYVGGELVGTSRKFDERLTLALLNMAAPKPAPLPSYTPGSCYLPDNFRTLLDRLKDGPEYFQPDETEYSGMSEVEVRAVAQEHGEDFEDEGEEDWDPAARRREAGSAGLPPLSLFVTLR